MDFLDRLRGHHGEQQGEPLPARAPAPQPERTEPVLPDPTLSELSRSDYVAIVRRALSEAGEDRVTAIAAALAYYAFLSIPSVLLLAVGIFSLVADPSTVSTLVDELGKIAPPDATRLVQDSLTQMTQREGTGIALIGIGGLLAVWSIGGAMENLMWALNVVYERDETRGFLRRRSTAWAMALFAFLGVALAFGLLVLGHHFATWIGRALDAQGTVSIVWWGAQWPFLVGGLLVAYAGILYLGPNVEHPRWRFLSLGAIATIVVWLLASGAFAFYASRFGSYNKTWGSLSAVVLLLTWFWLSAVALLFGAEINAEAERSRELRRGEPAEVELQAPTKA